MRRLFWIAAFAAATAACGGQSREARISEDVDQNVRDAESRAQESRTLSSLAKIEESVATYVKTEKAIPETLDQLVPKYLAEIPPVEIGVRGHRDTAQVKTYPSLILRDGQIDGSQLKDSGRWGYVHNDRQVVVFIDCTHQSGHGHPWYETHGAY